MAIEIGSLVVKGHFGPSPRHPQETRAETARQLAEMRRDILEDVREMIADATQRSQDR
ncbi:hypothetical protein KX928_02540 [Roseobacter sp. YSTF-M11]|uniref:Uncharacterized protein n=1 Tax=Roseobacter insulae TaxID=2859783 RepID=A0A9X1FRW9_9RHOB|nr:DUF5908 family protein [Roseobacter insulae]MBW4706656.1 hypothetical protein [Roseobacter insulae]